jgi:hypothetical protein
MIEFLQWHTPSSHESEGRVLDNLAAGEVGRRSNSDGGP